MTIFLLQGYLLLKEFCAFIILIEADGYDFSERLIVSNF
jgi:hypothetical protein